jgi:hypothetical protein
MECRGWTLGDVGWTSGWTRVPRTTKVTCHHHVGVTMCSTAGSVLSIRRLPERPPQWIPPHRGPLRPPVPPIVLPHPPSAPLRRGQDGDRGQVSFSLRLFLCIGFDEHFFSQQRCECLDGWIPYIRAVVRASSPSSASCVFSTFVTKQTE